MEGIQKLLNRGKHREMEHFTQKLVVVAGLLLVICTACFLMQQEQDRVTLGTQAVYSEKATFSLSGAQATVEGVYVNEDSTRAMALLKFSDVSKMNTDAAQYKMFVTGADPSGSQAGLASHPSGGVYVFGSSGYAGLYLSAADGFPSQILDVVVRVDRQLADSGSSSNSDAVNDASFNLYDQARLYFNPGAAEAEHAASLDADTLSPVDLYEEMVSSKAEAEVREELDVDLEAMRIALNQIDEYTERAERDGLVVPAVPAAIAGDAVVTDEEGNLSLETDTVVTSGFDFDWRDGSVAEGYLDGILRSEGGGRNATQYLVDKAAEAGNGSSKSEFAVPTDDKWTLASGQSVTAVAGGSDTQYKTYTSDISLLTGAWSNYYQLKKDYQAKHLRELLVLELDAEDAAEGCTVRTGEGTVTLY